DREGKARSVPKRPAVKGCEPPGRRSFSVRPRVSALKEVGADACHVTARSKTQSGTAATPLSGGGPLFHGNGGNGMQIINTMTRKKEEFVAVHEGKVGIYACGPTVYNYFHIGNARPFIIFDTLRRFLKHMGYDVTFVQNFTDIDDKMIRRANEEHT